MGHGALFALWQHGPVIGAGTQYLIILWAAGGGHLQGLCSNMVWHLCLETLDRQGQAESRRPLVEGGTPPFHTELGEQSRSGGLWS